MSNNTKHRPPNVAAAPTNQPFWRSPFIWVIALILVAGGAAIILAALDRGDSSTAGETGTAETASAEIIGTSLPPFATPDPAIGLAAPAISAQTLQGQQVDIGNDGTARLYGFFAHWCPHCQNELPRTAAWLETNDLPDGVEVVAISTAVDSGAENYPPSDWFTRENWPATVLVDDTTTPLATGLGLTAFPFWVAVDSDGNVVARVSGALSDEQFESLIAALTPAT